MRLSDAELAALQAENARLTSEVSRLRAQTLEGHDHVFERAGCSCDGQYCRSPEWCDRIVCKWRPPSGWCDATPKVAAALAPQENLE